MKNVLGLSLIKFNLISLQFFTSAYSFSQDWVEVGGGLHGPVAGVFCFYADTNNQKLYVGGGFVKAGNDSAKGIAMWDGFQWSKMGNGTASHAIYSITKYRNDIIASSSGDFFDNNSLQLNCIAKWNGISWDSLQSGIDKVANTLSVINDTLYVGGPFRNANNMPANLLAKWDGINWHPYQLSNYQNDYLYSIHEFNNLIYLGGNFNDSLSPIFDFCLLSGNHFLQVDTFPIAPGGIYIAKMMNYNNEMYIGGEFYSTSGNNIIKYDGTNFHSLGGADYGISDMAIFNNELIVVGNFDEIGGFPIKSIARWNGFQWQSVTSHTFDNYIRNVAVLNNELYIGGWFNEINGQPVKHVAKYIGPLSIKENDFDLTISIFPNPSNEKIYVRSKKIIRNVKLFDIYGNELISDDDNSSVYELSISHLSNGIYYLQAKGEMEICVKKIIKN